MMYQVAPVRTERARRVGKSPAVVGATGTWYVRKLRLVIGDFYHGIKTVYSYDAQSHELATRHKP